MSARKLHAQIDAEATVETHLHKLHPLSSNCYTNWDSPNPPEKYGSNSGLESFIYTAEKKILIN